MIASRLMINNDGKITINSYNINSTNNSDTIIKASNDETNHY